jgi:hypothetical protein
MIQNIRFASSLAMLGAGAVASGALLAVCFAACPPASEVNEPLALEAATFNLARVRTLAATSAYPSMRERACRVAVRSRHCSSST